MKEKNKSKSFLNFMRHIGACLLRNLLTGKFTIRAGEATIRAGPDF